MTKTTTSTAPLSDIGCFLRGFFAQPRAVASLFPSSGSLARAIARQAGTGGKGLVLELGPGTGAVTRALRGQGIAAERLILIERDPAFARHLRAQFPQVTVRQGDALDADAVLAGVGELDAVICGLPLLNIDDGARRRLINRCLERLRPGGPFVQVSFGWHPPVSAEAHWRIAKAALVWRNIPPATVWTYTRRA